MESQMCADCDSEVFVDRHSTIWELINSEFEYHDCEVKQ